MPNEVTREAILRLHELQQGHVISVLHVFGLHVPIYLIKTMISMLGRLSRPMSLNCGSVVADGGPIKPRLLAAPGRRLS